MLGWTVVCLGCAVRLSQYWAGRALWVDEAMLAVNIGSRLFVGLAAPLDYDQVAPLPFLWAVKLATSIAGVNEYALRAVSLLAGCALLEVVRRVAARVCGGPGIIAAILITALCPALIYYTNELTPYSLDALVAMLLVLLGLDAVQHGADSRRLSTLVWAGTAAIWLSMPAEVRRHRR